MKGINSRLLTQNIGVRNNMFRLNDQEKKITLEKPREKGTAITNIPETSPRLVCLRN